MCIISDFGGFMKFACYTLGCKVNQYETQAMEQLLMQSGHTLGSFDEICDGYIINTCTVTAVSDKKSRNAIRRVRKLNPNAVVGVCGCYAQSSPDEIRKLDVDVLIGTDGREAFVRHMIGAAQTRQKWDCVDDAGGPRAFEILPAGGLAARTRALLKVEDGCNNFCTYCIVPYVRGRERSREKSLILDEARQMISAGYKDITLLGQNVNSYGKTLADKPTFAQLLHEIDSIDGDYWLRFMTSHPKDCSKELIDTIANGTHISKHLHLPFQSGSDRILKAMNRHYDRKKYLDIVNYAKEKIDGVSLTSDIIVGFPGETYEDFKETLSLIREVEFTSLFTFIYSPRVGTPAAKMDDPISAEEKSKWFRELLDVQEEIAAKRCASMVNNTEKVLIESETGKNGELNGRTSGNIIVELKGDKSHIGTFQNVKITQARNWILKGELV